MNYRGVLIEESLENKDILKDLKISSTEVEEVTDKHKTPWVKQWTMHTVEIPEENSDGIAEMISHTIDRQHANAWYANFLNESFQYVIFRDKVFKVDRSKKEQYQEVTKFGLSLGIPKYQLDFPL